MIWGAIIISFAVGILVERARSRVRIGQRETARADMLIALGGAVDLDPCEFTHTWQERPH